jgi:hypothetical protein
LQAFTGSLWRGPQASDGSTSFSPTLTDWKFIPKIAGVPTWAEPPLEGRPSIWLRIASTLI